MKVILTIFLISLTILSCKEGGDANDSAFAKAEIKQPLSQEDYSSYGAQITTKNVLSNSEVAEKYASLKEGDTAVIKFEAPINAVCQSKGCWMRLDLPEEEQVFVKFKDYGFFVPLDATGTTIVQGKAYLEEVTVDELQHMARDAGKSTSEIAAITAPERELRFMADGVLIKGK